MNVAAVEVGRIKFSSDAKVLIIWRASIKVLFVLQSSTAYIVLKNIAKAVMTPT